MNASCMPFPTLVAREKKQAALKVRVNIDTKRWAQTVAVEEDLDESDIIRRAIKFYRAHGSPRAF